MPSQKSRSGSRSGYKKPRGSRSKDAPTHNPATSLPTSSQAPENVKMSQTGMEHSHAPPFPPETRKPPATPMETMPEHALEQGKKTAYPLRKGGGIIIPIDGRPKDIDGCQCENESEDGGYACNVWFTGELVDEKGIPYHFSNIPINVTEMQVKPDKCNKKWAEEYATWVLAKLKENDKISRTGYNFVKISKINEIKQI